MRAVLLVFRNELRRVLTLRPAFAVLVIAAALYALLYPQPYLSESLRKSPIAIVDQDHSTTSRDLIRRLDAMKHEITKTQESIGIERMRQAERESVQRMVSLLKGEGNYQKFQNFKKAFFNKHK